MGLKDAPQCNVAGELPNEVQEILASTKSVQEKLKAIRKEINGGSKTGAVFYNKKEHKFNISGTDLNTLDAFSASCKVKD